VTDYTRFLGTVTTQVLPYLGGPFVEAPDRRLRLAGPATVGYWLFEVRGRIARPTGPAQPPDLSGLPAVRGYAVSGAGAGRGGPAGYLVGAGGSAQRLGIGPPDEPLPFAPLIARRWPNGSLLFDALDFESGVEDQVREAFAARRTLTGIPGVPAALRAAYAYAMLLRTAAELGVPARPAEARTRLAELADEGEAAARRLLMAAQAHRAAEAQAIAEHRPEWMVARDAALAQRAAVARSSRERVEERAAAALHAARAVLLGTRWLADGLLEVRYEFAGEWFVSIVDGQTLQVVDAGICLQGRDELLTLESLPGVIREAMRTGRLHVTAW
jgi:hypothetical protein